jgi:MFS family permease
VYGNFRCNSRSGKRFAVAVTGWSEAMERPTQTAPLVPPNVGLTVAGYRAVEAFFLSRRARLVVALASFSVGILLSLTAPLLPTWLYGGTALVAMALATALGLGKTTTACGLNVLSYLGGQSKPGPFRLRDAAAYAAASTLTAAAIGAILGLVGGLFAVPSWTLLVAGFLLLVGFSELSIINLRFVPSRRWQVPVEWVRGHRFAPVIWGILLGSGVSTWMPFPSFFGLMVVAAAMPPPGGAILLGTYGAARAIPAFAVFWRGPSLIDHVSNRLWDLRLVGHLSAGCLTLALCGAIAAGLR